MLQFAGMASRFIEHVAHRLRRYIFLQRYVHLSVASEPVCDVTSFWSFLQKEPSVAELPRYFRGDLVPA